MTHDQLWALRDELIQACNIVKDDGGRIIANTFIVGDSGDKEQCCPMYALLGSIGGGKHLHEMLSDLAGFPITKDEVWSFIHSFDNAPLQLESLRSSNRLSQQMADLGKELRAMYIKE